MLSVTRLEAGQRQQPKQPRTRENHGVRDGVLTFCWERWRVESGTGQDLEGSDSAGLGRTEEGVKEVVGRQVSGEKVEARQPAEVVR
jgi:hypothetical protein